MKKYKKSKKKMILKYKRIYITSFHQLNGSIKICKKYINKYNATKKKERKEEKTRT